MAASSSGFEGARHRLADSSEMRTLCTNRSQPARRPRPIRTVALTVSAQWALTDPSGGTCLQPHRFSETTFSTSALPCDGPPQRNSQA